jgi:phosphotransferase system HPr (HPr) family protein
MQTTTVIIQWQDGIHLQRAGNLVRLARQFRSSILCRLGEKVADARSVLSILILCAGLGATLEIEASAPVDFDEANLFPRSARQQSCEPQS